MKFHVDALHSYAPDKKGTDERTDGRTDGRVNHYMPPFGGHNNSVLGSSATNSLNNIGIYSKLLSRFTLLLFQAVIFFFHFKSMG